MNIVVDQRPSTRRFPLVITHSSGHAGQRYSSRHTSKISSMTVARLSETLRPYKPEPLLRQYGLASFNRRHLQIHAEPTPSPHHPSIKSSLPKYCDQQMVFGLSSRMPQAASTLSRTSFFPYKPLPASKLSSHRHHP